MSPRQIRNIKPANLSITNKTLKIDYPHVVYQIRNIATFNKTWYQQKEKPILPEKLGCVIKIILIFNSLRFINAFIFLILGQVIEAVISLVLGLSPIVLYITIFKRTAVFKIIQIARAKVAENTSQKEILKIWLAMIKEIIKIIFVEEKKQPLYIHGVSISTNDGKKVNIYDYRQEYIEQIMASLHEVMENQDTPASYHFVVEGDLIQQSGNFDVGVNQGNIN
ncbi:hypothetical protein [Tolypothrix sp. VBCCA 56010]|uniref:hypothetical protein n=1 Tax=Tolypothrix sp. VBCCA 56010 TaxID=3137731 RepID=UPI003D7E2038